MRKPSSMKAAVNCFHCSLRAGSMPSMLTLPVSGFSRSSISRNSVVFPAPLLPTRPSTSPSPTLKDSMSQATVSPNDFFRLVIAIISLPCYHFPSMLSFPFYAFTLNIAFFISGAMEMQGAWPSCGKKMANMPG